MAITLLSTVLAVLIVFVGWLGYQLLAQNGRILERIERLEAAIETGQAAANQIGTAQVESLKKSRLVRDGVPQGTAAPDFQLPLVGGGELSLSQYRGRRVLLVFSDPQCGPCNHVAPLLQRHHEQRSGVDIVMVSRGDVAANAGKIAEHGLTFPVALQRHWEVSRLYGMFATPIGFLIDEQGIVAAPVAAGADRILALLPSRGLFGFALKPRRRAAQA